jgi:uncharacterized protein (TIGR03437 family)
MEVTTQYVMNVSSVNAATQQEQVAPESIAIVSGQSLSSCAMAANTFPLPTTMCDASVLVNGKVARLYSVSPTQIHYVVPANTPAGSATIQILSGQKLIASGSINVERVSPGLFSLFNDGKVRVGDANQHGVYYPFASYGNGVTRALDENKLDAQNQLVLYGTGLRNCSSLKNVEVRVNNIPVKVRYAGPQEGTFGLDQLNLELPEELQRQDALRVSLRVDGRESNPVSVRVVRKDQHNRGAAPQEGAR